MWVIAALCLIFIFLYMSKLNRTLGLQDGYRGNSVIESPSELLDYDAFINGLSNTPVTGITSRDQIINPYELINYDHYSRNARGKALADQHLKMLLDIQSKQEASYQEFYNSEEQQANRLRDAGLNPNLNELEPSQSSQAQVGQGSPLEGIPTSEEVALQGVSTAATLGGMFISGVSAFSQLAALPATIAASYAAAGASTAAAGLSNAQANLANANAEAINIGAISEFEKLASADVAARLADATSAFAADAANAGKQFDFSGWFADPQNSAGILDAYAPSDNPRYQAALNRVMSTHQKSIGSMYDVYGNRIKHQSSVAQMLASPYYDENLVLQVAINEPLLNAKNEVDLLRLDYEKAYHQLELSKLNDIDRQLYLDALDAELRSRIEEGEYKSEYFKNFKGDLQAALDTAVKQIDVIQKKLEYDIDANLKTIYESDPHSYMGQRALSNITGGTPMSFNDYIAYYFSKRGPSPSYDWFDKSNQKYPNAGAWVQGQMDDGMFVD